MPQRVLLRLLRLPLATETASALPATVGRRGAVGRATRRHFSSPSGRAAPASSSLDAVLESFSRTGSSTALVPRDPRAEVEGLADDGHGHAHGAHGAHGHSHGATEEPDKDEDDFVEMWNESAPNGREWGGPRGKEPTRYGNEWECKGRVSDF